MCRGGSAPCDPGGDMMLTDLICEDDRWEALGLEDLAERAARAALARVGLKDREDAFPRSLSLGQQRRLALARAFAGKPEMLIMDEPFVSLDPELAEAMLALTETLIAEACPATIFVTHARAEADRLASRVLELRGTPATLCPHLI